MGRREFYAVVDETDARIERETTNSPSSWEGYDSDPWYQEARRKSGRK